MTAYDSIDIPPPTSSPLLAILCSLGGRILGAPELLAVATMIEHARSRPGRVVRSWLPEDIGSVVVVARIDGGRLVLEWWRSDDDGRPLCTEAHWWRLGSIDVCRVGAFGWVVEAVEDDDRERRASRRDRPK